MATSPSAGTETQNPGSPAPATKSDHLTVLIFKDNFSARTFRIPMRWISQFGWLLAAFFLTAIVSIGLATKLFIGSTGVTSMTPDFLNLNNSASSSRVKQLEDELKEANAKLQALSLTGTPTGTAVSESGEPPVVDPSALAATSPISAKPFLFRGLPEQIQAPPTDAANIPIQLVSPQARWDGKTLKVRFALQYVSSKPGGQQGRILILARGPGAILTHPEKVFQTVGKDSLIDPNQGEYFSVSRFREAKADFGPLPSREWLKEVEVVILSSTGQLLIHQKISPSDSPSSPSAATPARSHAPAPSSTAQPASPAGTTSSGASP